MNPLAWIRRGTATLALLFLTLGISAHVGSPDTIWEGLAGTYPVRVIVRDPGVIPGLAEIVVRTLGPGVNGVSVTSAIWNGNSHAAPPPDKAVRVPGDSTLWSAKLWFMAASSYAVRVTVTGASGEGLAVVPVTTRASRVMGLPASLGLVLSALGLLLIAGLVTIVVAATGESTATPGLELQPASVRRARIAGVVTAVIVAAVVWFGRGWWGSEASAYTGNVERSQPFHANAMVDVRDGHATLHLTIEDSTWRARGTLGNRPRSYWTPLIPDHGKLMHAFLVQADGDGFAHLHPLSTDSTSFNSELPDGLPGGRYYLFADIVHESGWSQTLTAKLSVPLGATKWTHTDPDDAWTSAKPTSDTVVDLGDGTRLIWIRGSAAIVRGADAPLQFKVLNADGTIARLEAYLGMAGHLALVRDGGDVYVHLHPMGTASMAAQDALTERNVNDTLMGTLGTRLTAREMAMAGMYEAYPGALRFPYEFPLPGSYRMWVQVRHGGAIRTAAFRVTVNDSATAKPK